MPVKNVSDYEGLLYDRLYKWWFDYCKVNYKVDCKTEHELVSFLLQKTLINKTLLRHFFIEKVVDKNFLYYSVMYGFDMPTETGCYIQIYDDKL